MHFVWNGVGVLYPPKMTAFRKRGLNLGREGLSGQVTTDKRSTRLSRATLRHPCSRNLEHDSFSGYFYVHNISHILNDCFVRRQSDFFVMNCCKKFSQRRSRDDAITNWVKLHAVALRRKKKGAWWKSFGSVRAIKKDIKIIRISTREVSVLKFGKFKPLSRHLAKMVLHFV